MKKKNILIHGVPGKDFYLELAQRKDLNKIYVTESRPVLYGAKVVCRELLRKKITPTLICDNMVGFCLQKKLLDEIYIFFSARAKEGLKCFIGSLIYAICAKNNRAKIIAYPADKVNLKIKPNDILSFNGKKVATSGVTGYTPEFEFVPEELISKIED